jgi:Tol biopolymer transport system component
VTLETGTRLGPYEIATLVGIGGMGEVYRAIDTNLKRPVAVKVLQSSVTGDPERLARFQREAELLAALNHPNIASIYGLERADGRMALVMELVEGPTLADRIAQGPLPPEEALAIATQIADALETAHELGIIHRDLKPANLKVRADGTVKVLDFGLAKAADPGGDAAADETAAPTITTPAMTRVGTILGTAAYMSPEQARGRAVDKRSDIWAFGCVLFEMLTGRRAFEGDDVAEVLGAVIHKAVAWDRLPAPTPVTVRAVLERCVEKDPRQRIRDMGDVRLALGGAFGTMSSPTDAPSGVKVRAVRRGFAATLAAALAGIAAGAGGTWMARTPPSTETVAFKIDTPNAGDPTAFAVSPDGRQLVFLQDDNGVQKLWLRPLAATSGRVIPGTEGASSPFWSPDSRKVAYFSPDGLEQVDLAAGTRSVIARVRNAITAGGTWSARDLILFANAGTGVTKGIFRVSASGGDPQPVTTMAPGDNMHGWPEFLPDGRHFLYVRRFADGRSDLVWRDLESTEERVVRPLASKAWYSPTGHLVFHIEGPVLAQRFDASAGAVSGDAIQVAGNTWSLFNVRSALALSPAGILAHRADDSAGNAVGQVSWVDRSGKMLAAVSPPGDFRNITLDRSGELIAANTARDVWMLDASRGTRSRLTFDAANDNPVFSPDGGTILFSSTRSPRGIYRKAASGAGAEQLLVADQEALPRDWSPNGRFVSLEKGRDLWILPLDGDRRAFPYLATPAAEQGGQFSPDGRWIAYWSDETGRDEVFLQDFPAKGTKFQVSTGGGSEPRWRRDGRELFYLDSVGQLMSVAVTLAPEFRLGVAVPVFRTQLLSLPVAGSRRYGVSADGQRFLMNVVGGTSLPPITVILNWQKALEGR